MAASENGSIELSYLPWNVMCYHWLQLMSDLAKSPILVVAFAWAIHQTSGRLLSQHLNMQYTYAHR